jgi:hypothetical protein
MRSLEQALGAELGRPLSCARAAPTPAAYGLDDDLVAAVG